MATNNCPICERNDKIEKVSVIYMNGSHNTTMSMPVTEINTDSDGKVYSTTRHQQVGGFNQTKLAQALHPPVKPEAPKDRSTNLIWWLFPFMLFSVLVVAPIFGVSLDSNRADKFAVIGLVIGIAVLAPRYSKMKNSHKETMNNYTSVIVPQWERSLEKWNSLYFCHRDGQVFILGQSNSVPLERMMELLR
jgi:hypothetical protein